jgi:hypothetical protein
LRVAESSLQNWQLQNNGKKRITLRKDDSVCDLKCQWNSYKSVARIWLVKTENPSACAIVNWKVCRIATACSPQLCECIWCNKSNHPIQNLMSHAYM